MRVAQIEAAVRIEHLEAAEEFFRDCFAERDPNTETLFVAHLDEHAHCLHLSRHDGSVCSLDFPIRNIVADAAIRGSRALILAHNHPSGDPCPSGADREATRRVAAAASALGCRLLDHLIFGGSRTVSFRKLGLL